MKEGLILSLILLALIGGAIWLIGFSKDITQEKCTEKFGANWEARYVQYGPNLCVNEEGTVKIP